MARLCAFLSVGTASLIGLALPFMFIIVSVKGVVPDGLTELVLGAAPAIGALVGGTWASLSQRNKGAEEEEPQREQLS